MRTLAVLFIASPILAADAPDYDKMKKEFAALVAEKQAATQAKIDALQKDIDANNEKIKGLKGLNKNKSAIADLERKNRDIEKEKAKEKDRLQFDGVTSPVDFTEGSFHKVWRKNFKPQFTVFQVIDESAALLKWNRDIFYFDGSTRGLVDGKKVESSEWVHCFARRQYKSIDGGTKTVLAIRFVD